LLLILLLELRGLPGNITIGCKTARVGVSNSNPVRAEAGKNTGLETGCGEARKYRD